MGNSYMKLDWVKLKDVQPEKASFILTGFIPLPICAVTMLNSEGGVGKALWVEEKVLTPDGWKRMKDLQVGDYVIGSDGKKTMVTGVYYQGKRQAYRVRFVDDTSVVCDEEHLWTVISSTRKSGTYTLKQLLDMGIYRDKYDKRYGTVQREYFYGVPVCKDGYEFGKDDFLLHPYVLGVLLGDGYIRNHVVFCSGRKEVVDRVKKLLPKGDKLTCKWERGCYKCGISGSGRDKSIVAMELEKYGLMNKRSFEKFIPDVYKNATLESRKQLIQGLIDTDGYVKNGRLIEYSTSSEQLAKDFLDVGRSIGMLLTIKSRKPRYTYNGDKKEGLKNYRIYQKIQTNKKIVSIEKLDKREMMCITVDNPDGLFVVNGYNITHNSRLSLLIADKLSVLEGGKSLLWLSEDYPGQVRYIFDEMIEAGLAHEKSLNDIIIVKNAAIQLAYIENRIFKPNYREIEKIAHMILDTDAKLLVLDPLLSFYGGNENDNSQADIFMLSLIELAKLTNIAILLIHHNRKPITEKSGTFRGATAFHNACRMRYGLDYIRDKDGNIDKQKYNAGYRRLTLEKDNWGGRKYFNKLSDGNIHVDIKVAPGWEV